MGFILLSFCRTFQRVCTWNEKNHGRKITVERHKNVWSKFTTESCLGRLKRSMTIQLHDEGVRCVLKRVNGIKSNNRAGPADTLLKCFTCLIVTGGVQSFWLRQLPLISAGAATTHFVELPDWWFHCLWKAPSPHGFKGNLCPYTRDNWIILSIEEIRLFCSVSMYLSKVDGTFQLCSTQKSCMVACHEHCPCPH